MVREVHLRTELFWVIVQQVVVISYRRLRTTYRSHPQGSRIQKPEIMQKYTFPSQTQFKK